jgi:ribokinase
MTILNPAPAIEFDIGLLELVDVLILNETELSFLTKHDLDEHSQESKITDAARSLQVRNDQTVCVTLGKRGALALCGDEVVVIRGRPVPAIDTTGAGDCFVGAMAARAAAGATIRASLEYANVAASLCVQRMGAGPSMPTAEEVHLVI